MFTADIFTADIAKISFSGKDKGINEFKTEVEKINEFTFFLTTKFFNNTDAWDVVSNKADKFYAIKSVADKYSIKVSEITFNLWQMLY